MRILTALIVAAALVLPLQAAAQTFPDKPVKIIVGVHAGAAGDLMARFLSDALSAKTGQRFVVEDIPGANGAMAAAEAIAAPKDGYTIMFSASSLLTVSPHINESIKWNPTTDFEPIVEVGVTPIAIAVHKDSPIQSLQTLFDAAKAEPGTLTTGVLPLAMPDFAVTMLHRDAKVDLKKIPFSGGGDIMAAALSREIDVIFAGIGGVVSQFESGNLKLIGVTTTQRMEAYPDAPTVAEIVPNYDAGSWFGFFGPTGMDAAAKEGMNRLVNDILMDPEIREKLEKMGTAPTGGSPDDMKRRLDADYERFGNVVSEIKASAK
ncbi:Bug family tripartite tricarboxylate transporter substrate binding protein [Marinivivus vitaminiproducens]|uniref:Bug family tripartite tricarboxylate transporter substrate binding protein n=1 Tax=Marinivivus vitaminiproducens TaxID=3035935 RepID=UPI00279C9B88|nr:tripartite tricarboxylate transporter substrate binding protein [Geminicoccaceae bacterium SCSIO 64248]